MSKVITSDDLQSYMVGKTLDDGLAQVIVDGVNVWVETQTGRCWGETTSVTESYSWQRTVWLRHSDVQSIDGVSLGWPGQPGQSVSAGAYYFDPLGRLIFYYAFGIPTLRGIVADYLGVSYTYGVLAVPDDLKMAALGIAAGMYTWASNDNRDVASVSVGSYQIQYQQRRGSAGPDPATSGDDAAWGVVASYKRRRV